MAEHEYVPDDAPVEGEVVDRPTVAAPAAIELMQRAEIDIQIATAHRFPRSVQKFRRDALSMATLDEETAASCYYSLPARKPGGDPIEGPSVRMAEIVAACWGNLRTEARIIEEAHGYVVARGVCFDLERNYAQSVEVRRSVLTKQGKRYPEHMIATTMNAAIAIALRNAIFGVVPRSMVRPIYLEAMRTAVGTAETLASNRAKTLAALAKRGVTEAQVCAALGKRGVEDIDIDAMIRLKALLSAIKEGETTVDEAFGQPGRAARVEEAKEARDAAETAPGIYGPSTVITDLKVEGGSVTQISESIVRWGKPPKKNPESSPDHWRGLMVESARNATDGDTEEAEKLVQRLEEVWELPAPGSGVTLAKATPAYHDAYKRTQAPGFSWAQFASANEPEMF